MSSKQQKINSGLSLGARLKRAREEKGLTIEQVNMRIRIHTDMIRRIEESDYNSWPGGAIYAKGFLKQYANFLELNTAEILAEYEALGFNPKQVELNIGAQKPSSESKKQAEQIFESIKKYRKTIVRLAVLLIGLALSLWIIIGTVRLIGGWIESISKRLREKPKVEQVVRAPERVSVSQNTAPPVTAQASVPVRSEGGAAVVSQKTYLNSVAQGNYPHIRREDPIMVEVITVSDVWLRVISDGKVLFESILKKQSKEHWLADGQIEMKMGRPEGLMLSVNGYNIGKPGNGKVKMIRLTREGMEAIS